MSKKKVKASARGRVKRRKTKLDAKPTNTEMVIGESTYTVGDVAWFVDEASASTKRPKQGELTAVYPNDSIAPAVGLVEYDSGKHRAIRAQLIGWTKKEATQKWEQFTKEQQG